MDVLASLLFFASGVCLTQSSEIVVAPDACETVQVAAEEMQTFLSQSLGARIPVVTSRTSGRSAIVLGSNGLADSAGVTTNGLVADAFRICTVGSNDVYIVGIDDPNAEALARTTRGRSRNSHERATCFGVYEFLERFVGVRFYFPGELGTIVPRHSSLVVPETDILIAPYSTERQYSYNDGGLWFEGEAPEATPHPQKVLNWWRLRMETHIKPCCHGTRFFGYMGRFAESHPEYFALLPDGRRHNSPRITSPGHPGQLCHTSAVWEEIYQDAKSYLSGEDASVRGIPGGWGPNCQGLKYVDVMPQDGMIKCACRKCQDYYATQPEVGWASALIWSNTVAVANRLKAEGVSGRITQMAYSKTRKVPDFDIPDNVDVMVAERGPFAVGDEAELKREYDEVKAWYDKLGCRKVWMWTYVHKYRRLREPGIIMMTPRAIAKYFKDLAPYISGGFMETEIDRSFCNLINWYVFSKVMWDPSVDVEALLAEYHRLMFGSAANEMAAFYREVEDLWINRISGKTIDTSVGPQAQTPSQEEIFTEIYSPDVIRRWDGYFAVASEKLERETLEFRRLALVRRETLDELKKAIAAYIAKRDGFKNFKMVAGEGRDSRVLVDSVVNKNRERSKSPVKAWANVWKSATRLHFSFECEEPEMDSVVSSKCEFGDLKAADQNMVGAVFCPSGKNSYLCQVYLTSAGSVSAAFWTREGRKWTPKNWKPEIETAVEMSPNGWRGKFSIPLSELPPIPGELAVNLVRTRCLKRGRTRILWGDYPDYYTDHSRFGKVLFE